MYTVPVRSSIKNFLEILMALKLFKYLFRWEKYTITFLKDFSLSLKFKGKRTFNLEYRDKKMVID